MGITQHDLKNFHIGFGTPLIVYPTLGSTIRFGIDASILYNFNPTISVGFQFLRGSYRDAYSGGAIVGALSDNEGNLINIISREDPEKNIQYNINTFGIVNKINIRPFKKINPFFLFSINYNTRITKIRAFTVANILDTPEFDRSMRNAEKGYILIVDDIGEEISDASNAIEIPYKKSYGGLSGGFGLGVQYNFDRNFALGLQIIAPDLINSVPLLNTRTVAFIEYAPSIQELVDFVEFPNPEEEENLSNNPGTNEVGYFGQIMGDEELKRKLYVSVTLTYKMWFKKF
ncbi:hypothetical protein GCM10023331_34460 [Algivirga pacifica]|uniref:Bacterial surface antigen (D15) domain-containing protein n=2 Tax=Algivirga pacifica TaxID=1162670 RepID=A0ABP9DHS7_9BACT